MSQHQCSGIGEGTVKTFGQCGVPIAELRAIAQSADDATVLGERRRALEQERSDSNPRAGSSRDGIRNETDPTDWLIEVQVLLVPAEAAPETEPAPEAEPAPRAEAGRDA